MFSLFVATVVSIAKVLGLCPKYQGLKKKYANVSKAIRCRIVPPSRAETQSQIGLNALWLYYKHPEGHKTHSNPTRLKHF